MMSVASPREFSANYSTITRRQHPPLPPPRDVPKVVAPSTTEQHYASSSIKSHYLSRTNQTGPKLLPSSPPPPPLPLPLHYQETEFSRTPSTPRPGSALGQLLSRFGTLRRKARGHFTGRSASSRRSETPSHSQIYAPASIAGFPMGASNTINTAARDTASPFRPRSSSRPGSLAAGTARIPQLPPSQPLVLDPEIYASGKRQVAPEEIYAEGARALDSNAERRLLEHELDPALMVEGETRTIIEEQSRRRADYRLLVRQLLGWLNDELAEQRIIVRDLQEDLYDGQVLCKLIEKLQRVKLDMVEVTQNELAQKYKLRLVLEQVNKNLASQARTWAPRISWSVEGIHNKNMIEILQLLIAMALYYRAPLRMPANVVVQVLVFQKRHDELVRQSHQVQLTDEHVSSLPDQLRAPATTPATIATVSDASGARRRDAFDTLIECAPEKLHIVKRSLARFCNRHLNKINMSCGPGDDLRPENFSDGLLLVFLIASLEDYFVPLGSLFTTTAPRLTTTNAATKHHNSFVEDSPTELPFIDANNNNVTDLDDLYVIGIEQPTALEPSSYTCSQPIEKLHNVNVALQLIQEAGLTDIRERVRAEEIVNSDLKAVLRALYAIFGRYKHL